MLSHAHCMNNWSSGCRMQCSNTGLNLLNRFTLVSNARMLRASWHCIHWEKTHSPRRGIEPRSPAWQAGILTTILSRITCTDLGSNIFQCVLISLCSAEVFAALQTQSLNDIPDHEMGCIFIFIWKVRDNSNAPEQSGAVEACWAHNPEVRGSKPRSAKDIFPSSSGKPQKETKKNCESHWQCKTVVHGISQWAWHIRIMVWARTVQRKSCLLFVNFRLLCGWTEILASTTIYHHSAQILH